MKTILIFLFFINLTFASQIKNVYILKDNPSLNFENIKSNQNFKKTTSSIQRATQDEYWIKIELDEDKFNSTIDYMLEINSRLEINNILFDDKTKKIFSYENAIDINTDKSKYIYIKIQNDIGFIDVNFKVSQKIKYLDKIFVKKIFFGISYGIVFSAFLYYLAFFIFNREKSFIYYSLTQLSMLLMIGFSNGGENIAVFTFLIFSNLFTKEFLNTKKHTPKLDKTLTFIIYFYIIDTILDDYFSMVFPTSIFLLFYIFTAIIVYNKTKLKPIIFYIVAWSIVIFTFIFIDFQYFVVNLFTTDVEFETIIHIIAPIESLILAFALSYKIKILQEQKIQNERLLIHQNKLASMGEMISNIAHQWRQPLTHLGYIFMNVNTAFKHQKLDDKYLDKKTKEANIQLEYMSNTIDDFRNFYMPQKNKSDFQVKVEILKAISIISSTLESNNITLKIAGDDFNLNGYESEFSQVILNLLTNAKDALVHKNIKEPKITITIKENTIHICDNAGGIKDEIKNKIFDPYFTTKSKGTGIGLYMSKVILETHFNSKLYHCNKDMGSCFYIRFNNLTSY